jgi:hypothetical protein
MEEEEYQRKYVSLRILKGIQEYLKSDEDISTALHPIRLPNELLYQLLKQRGAEEADNLIHTIFRMGLKAWSELLYAQEFGSEERLTAFIHLVRERNRKQG